MTYPATAGVLAWLEDEATHTQREAFVDQHIEHFAAYNMVRLIHQPTEEGRIVTPTGYRPAHVCRACPASEEGPADWPCVTALAVYTDAEIAEKS